MASHRVVLEHPAVLSGVTVFFALIGILVPVGAGGKGEVYRARDPRLQRNVALKILREEVAARPDRSARFERKRAP